MKSLKMLGYEEQVFEVVTDDLVRSCETCMELIAKLDKLLFFKDDIPEKAITNVAISCWNEYWSNKA